MAAYLLWKYHADAASPATAAVMIMPTVLIALFIGLRFTHTWMLVAAWIVVMIWRHAGGF